MDTKNKDFPHVGVNVMIVKDGKVLLGKRKGSHGAGQYGLPGGHLEYLESFVDCVRRETREETGVEIDRIRFLRLFNFKDHSSDPRKHYADIGFVAQWKSGEPKVMESDKCDGWGWYDISQLPAPLFGHVPPSIRAYQSGRNFYDDPDQALDKVVVAVSGGFDPIHIGHIRMMQEAKAMGDELVVILNNDNWLKKKKGHVFMSQEERKEIIESIAGVDRVVLTEHAEDTNDMSVVSTLRKLKPDIFANGGDRKFGTHVPAESVLCEEIGCREVFGVGRGGKVQSSSWLLQKFSEFLGKK